MKLGNIAVMGLLAGCTDGGDLSDLTEAMPVEQFNSSAVASAGVLPRSLETAAKPLTADTTEARKSLEITDITGGQSFKTRVEGELVNEGGVAFIQIEKYENESFRDALLKVIAEGNTLNSVDKKGRVHFRMACAANEDIIFDAKGVFMLDFESSDMQVDGECASMAESVELIDDAKL